MAWDYMTRQRPQPVHASCPENFTKMESYPLEYVLHHVPNMAVWGLSEAKSLALSGGSGKDAQDDASNSLRKALLSVLLAKNNKSVWEAATQKDTAFFHVTLLEQVRATPLRGLPCR